MLCNTVLRRGSEFLGSDFQNKTQENLFIPIIVKKLKVKWNLIAKVQILIRTFVFFSTVYVNYFVEG